MKKIIARARRRILKSKIRKAKRVLRFIDRQLVRMKAPTWQRQQIRRDIITSDRAWIDFIDLLEVKK